MGSVWRTALGIAPTRALEAVREALSRAGKLFSMVVRGTERPRSHRARTFRIKALSLVPFLYMLLCPFRK